MDERERPPSPYADVPVAPRRPDLAALAAGREVELEIGFGRGHFVLARAAARPEALVVGLEVRRKWVGLVDARARRAGLDNVVAWLGDARAVLAAAGPDGVASWVFLHFPDPWWKKRHRKRLLLTSRLAADLARLLRPGGRLLVQTDVEERARLYRGVLEAEPRLEALPLPDGASPVAERSHREQKCLEAGLEVHRLLFERTG